MWFLGFLSMLGLGGWVDSAQKARADASVGRAFYGGTFDPRDSDIEWYLEYEFFLNGWALEYVPPLFRGCVANHTILSHHGEVISPFMDGWIDTTLAALGFATKMPRTPVGWDKHTRCFYKAFLDQYDSGELGEEEPNPDQVERWMSHATEDGLPHKADAGQYHRVTPYGMMLCENYRKKVRNGKFAEAFDAPEDVAGFFIMALGQSALEHLTLWDVAENPKTGRCFDRSLVLPILEQCITPKNW